MALSKPTKLKCRACGSVYPPTYTSAEHADREHCDGPLHFYCDVCRTFVAESVCEACEHKAQAAAEAKRRQEARRREIAETKRVVERQIDAARRSARSLILRKKCRDCGGLYQAAYITEEHHDNEHCDGVLAFFCEECRRFQSAPICAICEQRAEDAEVLRLQREAEARRAAAERERLRKEHEERIRLAQEREERRQKAFRRAALVPGICVVVASVLCLAMTAQLLTHQKFVIPHTATIIQATIGLGIAAALSVFVIALVQDMFRGS